MNMQDTEIIDRIDKKFTDLFERTDRIDRKITTVLQNHESRISRIEGAMKIGIPIFVAAISLLIGMHLLI